MEPFKIIESLISTDNNLIQSAEELDKAIDHIIQLLTDAASLYQNKSYSTSSFISITACEEIAKANLGSYSDGKDPSTKRGRNLFRDHKTKHLLAAMPTVPMGERLVKSIGKGTLDRLMNMAKNSGFVKIREDSLYFQREGDKLIVPSEKIDKQLSRALLLFAIEVFDDALVGYTNHSMQVCSITNSLFKKISNA
ncbi:MAG: AbiV family abortive infection protein [Bacteroidetes bacterium]|nr:AbiV family abortive infection protein [Bacteroidota bacterium]